MRISYTYLPGLSVDVMDDANPICNLPKDTFGNVTENVRIGRHRFSRGAVDFHSTENKYDP